MKDNPTAFTTRKDQLGLLHGSMASRNRHLLGFAQSDAHLEITSVSTNRGSFAPHAVTQRLTPPSFVVTHSKLASVPRD